MPQVFQNPKRLVDEFKKSGEFDRLRRQLLTHFANSDEVRPLMSRVEEIAREKLASDERLEHKPREAVHSEVMQDMERYPIVERAVSDLAVLKDEALLASIEQYVRNIVRGESNDNTKLWSAQPFRRKGEDPGGEDNDESSEYSEDDEPGDDELLIITEAEPKETPNIPPNGLQPESSTNDPAEARPTQDEAKPSSVSTPFQNSRNNPLSSDARTTPDSSQPEHDIKPILSRTNTPHDDRPPPTVSELSAYNSTGEVLVNAIPNGPPPLAGSLEQQAEAKQEINVEQSNRKATTPLDQPDIESNAHAVHTSHQVTTYREDVVHNQQSPSDSRVILAQPAPTVGGEVDHSQAQRPIVSQPSPHDVHTHTTP